MKKIWWAVIVGVVVSVSLSAFFLWDSTPDPSRLVTPAIKAEIENAEKIELDFIKDDWPIVSYYLPFSKRYPVLLEFKLQGVNPTLAPIYLECDPTVFEVKIVENNGAKISFTSGENYDPELISSYSAKIRKSFWAEKALLTLLVRPKFYRGEIDYSSLEISGEGMEGYLKDKEKVKETLIQEIAEEIKKGLEPSKRNNPYFLIKATLDWFGENIEYSLVPKRVINDFALIITKGSPAQRSSKRYLLKQLAKYLKTQEKRFGSEVGEVLKDEEILTKLEKNLVLDLSNKDNVIEKSSAFLNAVARAWSYFSTEVGQKMPVEEFLETRMGQCCHQSKAFVIILHWFRIPAKRTGGWSGDNDIGGGHAWVVAWIKPYGWIEIDPVNGLLGKDFIYQDYFSYNYKIYEYDIWRQDEYNEKDYQVSAYVLLIEKLN